MKDIAVYVILHTCIFDPVNHVGLQLSKHMGYAREKGAIMHLL